MSNFKRNSWASTLRDDTIAYVKNILSQKDKKFVPKSDYREMLELCLIVLGEPMPNYTFHIPHACTHSRWMAKIIYSMKMYLFRHQLTFSKTETQHLKDVCLFVCLIYVKNWIKCCMTSDAPHNDLIFVKELQRYSKINKVVSEKAIAKFSDHLWYLGSELVVLSLFSDKVPEDVKHRMFEKMKTLNNGEWTKRCYRSIETANVIAKKELDDLVTSSSMTVLKSLKLDIDFMFENDVGHWKTLDSYKIAKDRIDSIHVVNDCAERSLKLMTDFNELFTNNESEKQNAIQSIEDNRKRMPSTKKSDLATYKKYRFE